jgi:hypothetical protein
LIVAWRTHIELVNAAPRYRDQDELIRALEDRKLQKNRTGSFREISAAISVSTGAPAQMKTEFQHRLAATAFQ